MADQGKTEKPTERRLKKAREQGQFLSAREFVSALQFLVFLSLLRIGAPAWFASFRSTARLMFAAAFQGDLHVEEAERLAWQAAWQLFLPLLAGGAAVAVASLAVRLATTRFGFSLSRLAPDLKRLNTFAKLKELPSQNLPALLQAVVMLPVFLWAVYVVARERIDAFLALPMSPAESGVGVVSSSLMELFWKAAGVFVIFGSVDLFRQIRRYGNQMRMTKQEIRDEVKDTEGNLQMKARVRRLLRDRRRRQMMKDVPKATAVIVNPTHFAVAIRYQMDSMTAPMVVAKGKNYLALRIRQIAVEHQIPVIENPPLAQALYKSVEPGQEIPPHLYRAVAEILAYIFKLMKGRLPG
jgi:flagellar biosynthetic protein FlhB